VDVPVSQQASPPRIEPPIQVEISSSSGTQSPPVQTEAPNSPEMSFAIQPELSSRPRAQSPTVQAKTSTPAEVNPSLPQCPFTQKLQLCLEHLLHQWPPLNKILLQFMKSDMRYLFALKPAFLLLPTLLIRQCCFLRIRPHHYQVHQWGIVQLPRQGKEYLKLCQRKC
jgi:hypothetical protein